MLFSYFFLLIAAADFTFARPPQRQVHKKPGYNKRSSPIAQHGVFSGKSKSPSSAWRNNPLHRRQDSSSSGACGTASQLTVQAPKSNIFQGLTDVEAAGVTEFLHENLNLTASANATGYVDETI